MEREAPDGRHDFNQDQLGGAALRTAQKRFRVGDGASGRLGDRRGARRWRRREQQLSDTFQALMALAVGNAPHSSSIS